MTTAHRATWKPARGGAGEDGSFSLNAPSAAVAIRDGPAQTTLKTRATRSTKRARTVLRDLRPFAPAAAQPPGNGLDDDVALDEDEDDDGDDGRGGGGIKDGGQRDVRVEGEEGGVVLGREIGRGGGVVGASKDERVKGGGNDDEIDDDDDDDDGSGEDSDSDDDAELRAELARIRAERMDEARRKMELEHTAAAAAGNPLLAAGLGGGEAGGSDDSAARAPAVKRRWDDDVVFKNQARRAPQTEVRFVNDTTRNDFHRRFLKRFVKN